MGSKGSDAERELFRKFWKNGYAVMRSPSSGSGRKHPQPDLLISDGEEMFGIETKASGGDTVYISKEEAEKLKEFCEKFGCKPLFGVRFDRQGWTFHHPEDCATTEKSYKVRRDEAGLKLVSGVGFKKQDTLDEETS